MNKKKLKQARNKVDQIDQKIFNLIKKRTQIIKYMLGLKKLRKEIVDHKRHNEIFKKNLTVEYTSFYNNASFQHL